MNTIYKYSKEWNFELNNEKTNIPTTKNDNKETEDVEEKKDIADSEVQTNNNEETDENDDNSQSKSSTTEITIESTTKLSDIFTEEEERLNEIETETTTTKVKRDFAQTIVTEEDHSEDLTTIKLEVTEPNIRQNKKVFIEPVTDNITMEVMDDKESYQIKNVTMIDNLGPESLS